jgi:hypothetical protein
MRSAFAAIGMALLLACGALPAQAESFDCSQPSSPLARLVCGDPLLRAADAEESGVYESALLASLDRPSLREEERAWFDHEILPYNWFAQHQAAIENAKIVAAYRSRADALRQETQAWRKFRRRAPSATLAMTCLELPGYRPGEKCEVDAFKPVEGDPSLRYQLQNYPGRADSVVVVLASAQGDADGWLPFVVAHSDIAHFTVPRVIDSPAGKLLLFTDVSVEKSGANESALYRFEHGTLQEIDNKTWLEGLGANLPKGLEWDHGIFPDYARMVAETSLSRPGDSNCCPTGGRVRMDLAIENDTVVLKNVSPEAPPAAGDRAN